MKSGCIYEQHDEVKNLLKFLTSSSIRTSILLSLNESPKNLSDLKKELTLESSTVIHSAGELEKRNFLFKKGDEYTLSPTGKILALKLVNLIKTVDTVKNHEKLWLNHEIEGIPEDLVLKIGDLRNSVLVEPESIDINKPHTTFTQLLKTSKKLKGVSPVFHPEFAEIVATLVSKGADVQLILTDIILKMVNDTVPNEILSKDNFKIYLIDEDVKEAFAVTNSFISFGLFLIDGIYDYSMDLVSDDKDAIAWGEKLFDYYLKKSKKVS